MTRYASSTSVSAGKSRDEIERILTRYGADQFMYGWEDGKAIVAFRAHGRHIRFLLPMPNRDAFSITESGRRRNSKSAIEAAFNQAVRQRWRALALVIKAKLEAVETGITEFEDEFLAQIVLPDGSTAGEFLRPQIALAYDRGDMPKLLPGPKQ